MKTRILVIIVILSVIGMAISFQMDFLYIPSSAPANTTDIEIKLEKTACYGPCPIYSVIIYGDGIVLYDGIQHVDNICKSTHQISKEDVDDLVELIYNLNYFSLKDRYEANWIDDSTVITSVKINSDEKTVVNYGHYGPDRLHNIEKKIDDLTNFIPFLQPNDDLSIKKLEGQPVEHFCSNIGFDKYPENLFADFLDNPYNTDVTFLNFTDDDFEHVPEFYELIVKSTQTDYPLNDRVRFTVSPEDYSVIKNHLETVDYLEFNKNGKTMLHQNEDSDRNYSIPRILMDDKLYSIHGLNAQVFSDRDVNMNIQYSGTLEEMKKRLVENTNPNKANLIYFEINEGDKTLLVKVLDAINQIHKSQDKIRMSEDVGGKIQDETQDFFVKQNNMQFDNDKSKNTRYFILNDTLYETSFVVC